MIIARALLLSLLLMGGLLLAGGSGSAAAQGVPTTQVPVEGVGSYTAVSPVELAAMLQAKDFPLVNVHIPYEGEIEATDLFIPYDQIEAHLDQLPADRSARVVLYCRSGHMGDIASRVLVRLGYTNIWNLDGGMIAWEQAGYPLLQLAR